VLFESSEESPGVKGLAIIPGTVDKFDCSKGLKVSVFIEFFYLSVMCEFDNTS
jgi:hypothetical protein